MVESHRTIGDTTTIETCFYISSLQSDAKQAVGGHWGIENSLQWVLDIAFREDESRKR
jgi:predicted transposase YbfD/YdcC